MIETRRLKNVVIFVQTILQSVTDFITECVRYYKVLQLLQTET